MNSPKRNKHERGSRRGLFAKPIRVSRVAVVAALRAADVAGKHGRDYHDWKTRLPYGDFVLASIPVAALDVQGFGEDRAQSYAKRGGRFPPIYVTYGRRKLARGDLTLYVANGNHRSRAAQLRGEAMITAFMPTADYERWVLAILRGVS